MSASHKIQGGMDPTGKYIGYQERFEVRLADRTWPDKQIDRAPMWCSVDLRDGNQALSHPMTLDQKLRFYQMLVDIGFTEIEIGYPAASHTEYEFARRLITKGLIPAGVTPQVLVAARPDLIHKTFDAIQGASEIIVHVYNSTSKVQREHVYRMSNEETVQRAVEATLLVRQLADASETAVHYEYTPESFTGTELHFARDICNAVIEAWGPTEQNKIIINLPSTVEMASPNVFADQIEWMCRNLIRRECVIVSVHPHNDRGTGIAAAEQSLLAGADRIEGTLFGNGERAGNVDVVVLALNLYTQGINPQLDFRNLPAIREVYEQCTGQVVPERHPYAGDAAPVAYSGTHQIAIRRTLQERERSSNPLWDVAYLPIDHADVGREYQPIVVNSQSGKNGTAFVLETGCGIELPKDMEGEVGAVVQEWCDRTGKPIDTDTMRLLFENEFVHRDDFVKFRGFSKTVSSTCSEMVQAQLTVEVEGRLVTRDGEGNGPIDAAVAALGTIAQPIQVEYFSEHSLGAGSDAAAIAYMRVATGAERCWGVGIDPNSERAAIKALVSATNRLWRQEVAGQQVMAERVSV